MPIDPAKAIGAELPEVSFDWTSSDVLLYHLAIGAVDLRYTLDNDRLQVLPSFAVVAPSFHQTDPPALDLPGCDINLAQVLHGSQGIEIHGPNILANKGRGNCGEGEGIRGDAAAAGAGDDERRGDFDQFIPIFPALGVLFHERGHLQPQNGLDPSPTTDCWPIATLRRSSTAAARSAGCACPVTTVPQSSRASSRWSCSAAW